MRFVFSKNIEQIEGSAIRDLMGVISDPEIISLAGGNPSPSTFPAETLAEFAQELIAKEGGQILQYGPTEGYKPLIESCAERNRLKGISSNIERILPVSGSSQAIDLAAKVMLDRGDMVLCESPTFMGALQTFHSYGAKTLGVMSDDEGLLPDDLAKKIAEHKPKMLYVIPNFQNPSGKTWSENRRKEVLEIAAKNNLLVLEDDPYGELRCEGEPVWSMAHFDEDDCVLHMSSFSKTISPGLRVGYATGHPEILRKMVVAKQGVDVHTSNLSQAVVNRFLRSGKYDEHVCRTKDYYRNKLNCMADAVDKYFPESAKYKKPEGGLFLWLELPEKIDTFPLLDKAIERKVAFVPGKSFFPDTQRHNCLRLNFSMASEDRITEGCKRLGELIKEELAR